jgi:sulfur-carrier protein adenylyltransferase/sulfurtransferase
MLTKSQQQRYQQHLRLPGIGQHGQARLLNAKVLCVGAGGLASPLLLYLAAAGVGTIGIVDADTVALSNLQRQILFNEYDVNAIKVAVAQKKLQQLNSKITLNTYPFFLTRENALALIQSYDIIADTSDNFATRYMVNDACFASTKPLVHASVHQFSGLCTTFIPGNTACYRCLFPDVSGNQCLNCAEAGVFGVVPGVLGCLQATEIIKWITQAGDLLRNRLLHVNLLNMQFSESVLQTDPDCPLCSGKETLSTLQHHKENTMSTVPTLTVNELKKMRDDNQDFVLLDVRNPDEYAVCEIGGMLIPLNTLATRLDELPREKKIVVHCRSGGRSHAAVELLLKAGFTDVHNLHGGIIAWIDEIDPTLARY